MKMKSKMNRIKLYKELFYNMCYLLKYVNGWFVKLVIIQWFTDCPNWPVMSRSIIGEESYNIYLKRSFEFKPKDTSRNFLERTDFHLHSNLKFKSSRTWHCNKVGQNNHDSTQGNVSLQPHVSMSVQLPFAEIFLLTLIYKTIYANQCSLFLNNWHNKIWNPDLLTLLE